MDCKLSETSFKLKFNLKLNNCKNGGGDGVRLELLKYITAIHVLIPDLRNYEKMLLNEF